MFSDRFLIIGLLGLSWTANLAQGLEVLGYYFVDESYDSLQAAEYLTQVSFDQFGINARGNIHGKIHPEDALPYAKNRGLETYLCVSNYGPDDFNGPRVHAVLKNAKYRNALVNRLVKKALNLNVTGVNIDFEAIPRVDRSRFNSFIASLADKLHANNQKLVISLPAIEEDNPNDDWSGAFDYATLGQHADILQVMTYDQHGPWGEPGPIAGLDWVQSCINFAKSVVPANKISMGVPAYGYVWNLDNGKGRSVNWDEFPGIIGGNTPKWDSDSSSPYVKYVKNGVHFVMWYENAQSLTLKGDFARSSGILGVSVWALYGDDSLFWNALLG